MRKRVLALVGVSAIAVAAYLHGPGLFGQTKQETVLPGYVEADTVLVGTTASGRLARLAADPGDRVDAGSVLFALDDAAEQAAVAEATARLAQAEAQLADLQTGKRPEEIAVLTANLAEAEAQLVYAQAQLGRQERLTLANVSAAQVLDEARQAHALARARVAGLEAEIEAARLPGRPDAIRAAEAAVRAAAAALREAEWRLEQRQAAAPMTGLVDDTFYQPGEFVPAGQSVVSILPDGELKLRFFAPQPLLASFALGRQIAVTCDGCAGAIAATVSYIAPEAEYTPPVIYSEGRRDKLVFMIEAIPAEVAGLNPGQPVEIRLVGP